jgi:biopolymer transport protein ExbD
MSHLNVKPLRSGGSLFFKKSGRQLSSEPSLQITSLADIFIIVLVFLIKSYSASTVKLSIPVGMKLPIALIEPAEPQGLKVEVTQDAIIVDDKPILKLSQYVLPANDMLPNWISQTLHDAFLQYRRKQQSIGQKNPSVQEQHNLVLIADQKTPVKTLKVVFASAAANGLTDVQLAIQRRE